MCALNFFVLKLTHPRQVKMMQTHLTAAQRRVADLAKTAMPDTEEAHLNTVLDFLIKVYPDKLKAAAASARPVQRARSPEPDFQRRVSPRRSPVPDLQRRI